MIATFYVADVSLIEIEQFEKSVSTFGQTPSRLLNNLYCHLRKSSLCSKNRAVAQKENIKGFKGRN